MKEISKDILLFENEIPLRIINTLNNLRETKEDIRFELNNHEREFNIFKKWWEEFFEPKILDYFLQYYVPE